jgi:signal peptidase I
MKIKNIKTQKIWVETAKTIGLSIFFALGMRTFVAQAFFIPTGSMEPTLQIDDRLLVDKVIYRFSDPQRGDVVVFDPTAQLQRQGQKEAFVKRVIGLPGDVVLVRRDQASINGQPLNEKYISKFHPEEMKAIYFKKMTKNSQIKPWNPSGESRLDFDGKVPAGQYLVLGDHRDDSSDSRVWGFVPKDKIVGKVIFKFWPMNRVGSIQPAYLE